MSKRTIPARLYDLPLRPNRSDIIQARRLTDLTSLPQPTVHDLARALPDDNWHWQPTSMDLSTDGRTAVVVTWVGVYLYVRRPGESFAEAFARQPALLDLGDSIEAEAVTLSQDGDAIFVTVEGQGVAIFRFDRKLRIQASEL